MVFSENSWKQAQCTIIESMKMLRESFRRFPGGGEGPACGSCGFTLEKLIPDY